MHSNCRVCIQAVGYAFKISRVLIQDVDPSFSLCCVCMCVCEVGWLPVVQVFVAALRCQSCFCIKTIQTEAKASAVKRSIKLNVPLKLSTSHCHWKQLKTPQNLLYEFIFHTILQSLIPLKAISNKISRNERIPHAGSYWL